MAFQPACALEAVWEGDMSLVTVDGIEVLLVHLVGGGVRAFDARCPHQGWSLGQGTLDGGTLTCGKHGWEFDVQSGDGVNPAGCRLVSYRVEVRDETIWVDVSAAGPAVPAATRGAADTNAAIEDRTHDD